MEQTHLESNICCTEDTYIRMLFTDFSSSLNMIIPQQLVWKLSVLCLDTPLCNWILDFWTDREAKVIAYWQKNINHHHAEHRRSPKLLAEPTAVHDAHHTTTPPSLENIIVKLADNTTILGLILQRRG